MPTFGAKQELDLTVFIDDTLIFGNPQSGQIKKIKIGFNWLCFLFDWIALFAKGLIGKGFILLGANLFFAVCMTISSSHYTNRNGYYNSDSVWLIFILVLFVWLCVKFVIGSDANKWHAESLASKGWILLNSHNEAAEKALNGYKWNLPRPRDEEVEEFITALSMKPGTAPVVNEAASNVLTKGLDKLNNLRGGVIDTNEPDPLYYAQAEQEIIDDTIDIGLWSKALVNAEGKEELRKVEYMKLRAKQLQESNFSKSH